MRLRHLRRGASPRPARRSRARGEEGGIGVLGIGLCLCLCLLVLGGICVHTAQVARVDVFDAADHAGAAAADRISVASAYERGVGATTLDAGQVEAEAASVLAATPMPDHVTQWRISAVNVEGSEVVVSVVATVQPPVIGGALTTLGAPMTVRVTSHAQAHLER